MIVEKTVVLPTLHPGQVKAYHLSKRSPENPNGLLALRAGRRWGKTDYLATIAGNDATKGWPIGWFAPSYKILSEAYAGLADLLQPVIASASQQKGVIRTITGGRIDFWTLEDERAGRSRMYKRVLIDEGAFTKPNMMKIWEQSIAPTLLDLSGTAIVASNTNGVSPENFLWQICNNSKYGFVDFHAPTFDNPHVPRRLRGESEEDHARRRLEEFEKLKASKDPLVFAQEYLAEFIDWSGIAFFSKDKLLVNGHPLPWPALLDQVFAVIDTSVKTGKQHDGTAVTFWGFDEHAQYPLLLLDWDYVQVEAAMSEVWLQTVFQRLTDLTTKIRCRYGSTGAYIEDQNVGAVLISKAVAGNWPAQALPSGLTALGKDVRAVNISGHVYCDKVKFTQPAYDKTVKFKGTEANHQLLQVTGFRVGDPDAAKRADDLLDTFSYGVAIALGNEEGFA